MPKSIKIAFKSLNNADYGVYISQTSPTIMNNIIVGNRYGLQGSNSNPTSQYNDIWNNTYRGAYDDGEGTIKSDPLLVDPTNNNFHLQSASPCINTGKTDSSYNDLDGSRNDMGVYGGPYARVAGNAPYTPSNPSPSNGATGISLSPILSWSGGDPDSGDTVTYDVYFGTSSSPSIVSSGQSATSYSPGTLAYSTTYYWKIVSRDAFGAETTGSVWQFTTGSRPNQTPVLNSIGNKTVAEGQTLSFTISATDADGDTLTYSASNLPSGASFNSTTKTFSWTPSYDQAGTYSGVHFEVSDGTATDSEDITITVTNVNRAPSATSQSVTTAEDTPANITLSGSDLDGDGLTYTVMSQPAHGVLSGTAPNLIYTPATNFAGTDSFTFRVNDGQANSSEATLNITVTPVNDTPIANAGPDKVVATASSAILDGTDSSDLDGDALAYQWTVTNKPQGSNITLSNNTSNTISFTPDIDGIYQLQLRVSDGSLDSNLDYVSIRALGQQDKIVIVTTNSQYKIGDKLSLCIWVGNSAASETLLVDAFIGFGTPDGSLLFLNSTLTLNTSDPSAPTTFTPFVQDIKIPSGFVFPGINEANIDTDDNGKKDGYLLYSFTLSEAMPSGEYFAFAAMAEAGSVRSGTPKIIGEISISEFSIGK